MEKSFIHRLYQSHQSCPACPSPQEITQFFDDLLGGLFADRMKLTHLSEEQLAHYFYELQQRLENILTRSKVAQAHEATIQFFDALPSIFDNLRQDVVAMFEGDPAAKSKNEVIRTYPGFYAIAAYRVAHQLHGLGAVGIPRIITEHAHSKTGIDIHPAARIGKHFCIDHGTGIVIGETTVIGDHVKIYQGVTLGALSVNKEDAEKKRHPTIEDHVVIYSGATILGGETTIGHHSVIGGNVWLTRSLPPHSKVYYQSRVEADDAGGEQKLIWKQA